jgi:hypothetical protein
MFIRLSLYNIFSSDVSNTIEFPCVNKHVHFKFDSSSLGPDTKPLMSYLTSVLGTKYRFLQ